MADQDKIVTPSEPASEVLPSAPLPAEGVESPGQAATHASEWHRIRNWLVTDGKSTTIVTVVGLVVLAGWFWHKTQKQARIDQASLLLNTARSIENLQEVAADYAETPSAPLAMLLLARTYYDSGNIPVAENAYAQFEAKYPKHLWIDVAKLGRIHCLEARGALDQAADGFAEFARQRPDHYLTPIALFGKARCLTLLGRDGEARVIYEDFIAAHPESPWVAEAEEAIEVLDRSAQDMPPVSRNQG